MGTFCTRCCVECHVSRGTSAQYDLAIFIYKKIMVPGLLYHYRPEVMSSLLLLEMYVGVLMT